MASGSTHLAKALLTNRFPKGMPDPMPGNDPILDDHKARSDLCLDWTTGQSENFISGLPTSSFAPLDSSSLVPPKNTWALEEGTSPIVETYLKTKIPGDNRTNEYPAYYVSPASWRKVVAPEESVILKDSSTGEIFGVVIRDYVPVQSVLNRMDKASEVHVNLVLTVRRNDPGLMGQYGYTSGARSALNFDWAKNLLDKHTPDFLRLHNHEMMSAHTLIWNIATKKVPHNIISDYKTAGEGMPKGDWNLHGADVAHRISVTAYGHDHELSGLELGPASGICAQSYSRACHHERPTAGAPWIMSLTTGYDHERLGGNFYYAKYGVLVKQAPNTFVIHKANDYHGTTVHEQDYKPEKRAGTGTKLKPGEKVKQPQVCHRGFSLLIPPNLKKTYHKSLNVNRDQVDVQQKDAVLDKSGNRLCVITGRVRKTAKITTCEAVLAKPSGKRKREEGSEEERPSLKKKILAQLSSI